MPISPPSSPASLFHHASAPLRWSRWLSAVASQKLGRSPDKDLNHRLLGYPRNHDYLIADNAIVPSPRLFSRWTRVASLYPEPLTSLLDVGCSKGCFVLEAASRPTCNRAVGTDVDPTFVDTSRQVASRLNFTNASFHVTGLDAFAADPSLHGDPFQAILVLNVYHYLYAGSDLNPAALRGHRPILESLARLCAGRVIFSSPLELAECPDQVQSRAAALGIADTYTRNDFVRTASEFFDIEDR